MSRKNHFFLESFHLQYCQNQYRSPHVAEYCHIYMYENEYIYICFKISYIHGIVNESAVELT
jgi:hypothetical protein